MNRLPVRSSNATQLPLPTPFQRIMIPFQHLPTAFQPPSKGVPTASNGVCSNPPITPLALEGPTRGVLEPRWARSTLKALRA